MKILDTYWFQGGGIVRVEDEYEGIKYYIKSVGFQLNQDADSQHIADWGNTFPKAAGDALFGVDELRNGTAVQIPTNEEQARLMVLLGERFLKENT